MNPFKASAALAVTTILALSLVSCSSTGGTVSGDPATQASQSSSTSQAAPESSEPKFGQTYTWKDGTAVTVSAPEEFTPGEWAAGPVEGQANVKFTVTLLNNSGKPLNAIMFTSNVLSGGKAGEAIFDSGNGLDMPSTDIPNGKSLEFVIGYSVADASDITMTVSPDAGLTYDKVAFTN